jgi:uncharacterized membrane protein
LADDGKTGDDRAAGLRVTTLVTAAAVWIGIHTFISGGTLRGQIVALTGDRLYRGAFALLSTVSLVGLSLAYANAKATQPVELARWMMFGLAAWHLVASVFIVGGLTTGNPGTSGMEDTIKSRDVVVGILRITRHPFLWGVAMWCAANLVVRHDPANIIFFGAIGYVALAGTLSIDRKRARSLGTAWTGFAGATSNVPFLAIIEGRQRMSFNEIGLWRAAVALVLWLAVICVHPMISGGKPF